MPFFYGYRGMTRAASAVEEIRSTNSATTESNEGLLVHRKVPRCEIIDQGRTKKELRCEIQIFATPERLWSQIISIQRIRATKEVTSPSSGTVDLRRIPFGILRSKGKVARAELIHLSFNSELGWKQRRFLIPGLFEKETLFQIVPHVEGTGTTVIRTETFRGLLVPLMKSEVLTERRDIQLGNMELREKAENIS